MVVPNLFSLTGKHARSLSYTSENQFRNDFDEKLLKNPADALKDVKMFRISWVVLGILIAGYFLSETLAVPVSFIAGAVALVFLLIARRSPAVETVTVSKRCSLGNRLFLDWYVCCCVRTSKCRAYVQFLTTVIEWTASHGLYAATIGMGFIAAILSSVMNNMPTVMIDALAIKDANVPEHMREALIYANVIGSDLGPKMTPIGSLATLLWLHVLSTKGVKISWGYYFKVGIILTIPTLFITLTGLYVWLTIFELRKGWLLWKRRFFISSVPEIRAAVKLQKDLGKVFWVNTFDVYSAGIEAHGLNPKAVEAMTEVGVDISNQTSDLIDTRYSFKSRLCHYTLR